ncbi:MAG TPA: cobalamin biosynthesis protein CobQ [Patescibacteria group bacterium]|nr:cobalamin biosynthesis protein CobQ [Patescibacteria group bacterium]
MNLTIGWLYPRLMNVYGDIGNVIVLKRRTEQRGIKTIVINLDVGFSTDELNRCDLLFMGGAQDRQQTIVSSDLRKKAKKLKEKIESGTPGLYVCGAFQFLGKYYKEADGTIVKGLGIFDLYTENPGESFPRLIGNVAIESELGTLIGFENHGGRTYLEKDIKPLGKVIKGFGNNGKDKTEGAIYKNSFGTYFHGPILPKNPKLADHLIKISLEKKYGSPIKLSPIENMIEEKARKTIAMRLGLM